MMQLNTSGISILSRSTAEITIRRDINVLAGMGVLEKVHGGAVPVRVNSHENKYSERKATNEPIKRKLGAFVGKQLKDCNTIFLTAGTAVITNSLPIAETIGNASLDNKHTSVMLIGGKFNSEEHYTYGSEVVSTIRRYHADVVVISAVGIDEQGAMCASSDEGIIMSEMINSSAKVILLADSSKFGKKAVFRHCPMDKIDYIVTDNSNPVPEKILKAIKKKNITIDIVK